MAKCNYPHWTLPRTASVCSVLMGKNTQGEATEEKQRRLFLTWGSRRLRDHFMACMSLKANAFFAWKERFSSACSCLSLLIEGSSTWWAPNWAKLYSSLLGTHQPQPCSICVHGQDSFGSSQLGMAATVRGGGQRHLLKICSYVGGSCQPKTLGTRSGRMVAPIWNKRLEKQLQVVSEGNTAIL